jgi:hypothetical protein
MKEKTLKVFLINHPLIPALDSFKSQEIFLVKEKMRL